MIVRRSAHERGHSRLDWLDSRHTFSFAEYHDPQMMGFGALRVINDDVVAPGRGFGAHSHRDMEIITCVLDGELEHRDSMGNGSIIRPGELQRMSAGTGVVHAELNPSEEAPVRFLQMWIVPERRGLAPGYEQKRFSDDELRGRLALVAAHDGREGALTVHQDVSLHLGRLAAGQEAALTLAPGRRAWVQVARGTIRVNELSLDEGDGAAVQDETRLALTALSDAELLLFDLA